MTMVTYKSKIGTHWSWTIYWSHINGGIENQSLHLYVSDYRDKLVTLTVTAVLNGNQAVEESMHHLLSTIEESEWDEMFRICNQWVHDMHTFYSQGNTAYIDRLAGHMQDLELLTAADELRANQVTHAKTEIHTYMGTAGNTRFTMPGIGTLVDRNGTPAYYREKAGAR